MRRLRFVAIGALSIAIVFAAAPAAFAGHRGRDHRPRAPYRISSPSVADERVAMGASFDVTGTIVPAIAPDDTSTTVSIEVFGPSVGRDPKPLLTVPTVLAASPDTGTVYAATLTLADPGHYLLVAVVSKDGAVVARSKASEITVLLPYTVSKPRIGSKWFLTGAAFDATGSVVPAIAADDASTTVEVRVFQLGRRQRPVLVSSAPAVLTGPVGEGTGYTASITLPTSGHYVLVAVVLRDGVVLGRSRGREVRALDAAPTPPTPRSRSHRH
jgi:hypothetical protein